MEPRLLEITGTRGSGRTTALISMLKYSVENDNKGLPHLLVFGNENLFYCFIDTFKEMTNPLNYHFISSNMIITYIKRYHLFKIIKTPIHIRIHERFMKKNRNRCVGRGPCFAAAFFEGLFNADDIRKHLLGSNNGPGNKLTVISKSM